MRDKIETFKAGVAFVIFLLSVSAMDSEYSIVCGIIGILAIAYMKIVAGRICR